MGRMLVTLSLLGAVMTGTAVANEARIVAEKHRWNLADLYPSEVDFDAARKALAGRLPGLRDTGGGCPPRPLR